VLLVAHRTPPTRAACERIAAAGARVFEVDVQVGRGAAHDRVVVSHYLDFGRFMHRDNWRVRWHTGAVRDPALADVVALVPEDCLVLLDMKESRPERRARLVAALIESLPDLARFRVCGHIAEDLEAVRAAGFGTWRTARDSRDLAAVLTGGRLPDEGVSIRHTLLTPRVVEQLHERTPTVVAWTVNSLPRAQQLRAMGVDGITTDRAAILHGMSSTAH
jgi:glycerophosphoryl diester phosphodiesterase